MAGVVCSHCRHTNPLGARLCVDCAAPLSWSAQRRAVGYNPLLWLQIIGVGQAVPFILLMPMLAAAVALAPYGPLLRQLALHFGLLGLVALGVTFPLLKGEYDFAAGPVAGLAACCATLVSPAGAVPAMVGVIGTGCMFGLLQGFVVGWTRLSSATVTIITGAVALHLTLSAASGREMTVTDPLLVSLGDTTILGIPVVLALFLLALPLARILLNRQVFWPVGGAPTRAEAAIRASSTRVLLAFLISGLMAGLAGLLIACAQLPAVGPTGQTIWILGPLAAALIGGGSVAGGAGNLRTATVGAALVCATNSVAMQLHMSISGPAVESLYLIIGLLGDRWKNMTWYMITELRRGNLMALPQGLRLPMFLPTLRLSSTSKALAAVSALLVSTVSYGYVSFHATGRVSPSTIRVVSVAGFVEIGRSGMQETVPAAIGDLLHPRDTVTTGQASEVILRFHDGSRLRLRSATEISVEELMLLANETSRIRVRMAVGELFANVRRLPTRESRFVVDSPLLTVGVRGTAFHMVVEATQARVNVTEGEVEVTRRFTAPDPVTGATTTEEVVRTLKTGEWLSALSGRRQVLSDQLTREDVAALSHESVKISPDEWRILRQPATWLPFVAIVISVLLVYLLVVFVQPVLAPIDVEEVSAAARRLDQQGRERRASDSPAAAALAQMYLNLGDLETARRELQSIVDVDPNSEFGQWALRTLAALERRQPGR